MGAAFLLGEMMVSESEKPSFVTDLTGAKRVGSDEFFYDIFGVNLKGLKSIWVLFKSPAEYFEAARLPDWGGDHWPSIRVWLGLMGILVALQFIWASENSQMTAMFQTLAISVGEGMRLGAEREGDIISLEMLDPKALGKRAFQIWVLIYPFFFILSMCALAFIFRAWKPAVGFVVRLRYIFAIIVPGTIYGLFSTLAMVNLSGTAYQVLSFAQLGVLFIMYGMTAYRGAFTSLNTGERIGMSAVVAALIIIFLMIAQITAMMIAIVPVSLEVIDAVRPQIEALSAGKE